jgi:hypothetical protein
MFLRLCGTQFHQNRLHIHLPFKETDLILIMLTKLKGGKIMERKTLGVFAFAMLAILAVGAVSAVGFQNRMSDEDREALKSAMEVGDYDSWANIKRAQISEEKFSEQRARHQERAEFRALMQTARESGDRDLMQDLKAEFGQGKGMHKRNVNSMPCSR